MPSKPLAAGPARTCSCLRSDKGSATAELAIALPAVAVILGLGVGALHFAATQVQVSDAAADYARAQARSEDGAAASALLAEVPGAVASVETRGDLLCATVTAPGAVAPFDTLTVAATSCALAGGL